MQTSCLHSQLPGLEQLRRWRQDKAEAIAARVEANKAEAVGSSCHPPLVHCASAARESDADGLLFCTQWSQSRFESMDVCWALKIQVRPPMHTYDRKQQCTSLFVLPAIRGLACFDLFNISRVFSRHAPFDPAAGGLSASKTVFCRTCCCKGGSHCKLTVTVKHPMASSSSYMSHHFKIGQVVSGPAPQVATKSQSQEERLWLL